MADEKSDPRTCRACGEGYPYPEHKGLATRSYCEHCVQIPKETRRALERMRRRVDRLTKEVATLKE
ncbi:MAG: hypothetical protein QGI83_20285 [Candidatus Latescibacteria bacterium]|jgi:hypothetical protein|nr:hypothetical protein [Candidatus Latescibacterota bacterium]